MSAPARVVARHDDSLDARVVRCVAMRYAAGADPRLDRPAHVRAASGLAWVGERLAVVQDDASFVALIDPATGLAEPITLPAGPAGRRQFDDGRGNKAHKLDIEAIASADTADGPLLVAFGSGSSARRERVVTVRDPGTPRGAVAVHRVPRLYARLRELADFAGSELNVEGLLLVGDRLRLFARGNGAPRDGTLPVDATCDLSWRAVLAHLGGAAAVPVPRDVVQYDLGALEGVRLGFTDAVLASADDARAARRILYTAAAEASPDATRDGDVAGSAIGILEEDEDGVRARWTALRDAGGQVFTGKVEGIARVPGAEDRVLVTVDRDDPARPSELCEVRLRGPWGL